MTPSEYARLFSRDLSVRIAMLYIPASLAIFGVILSRHRKRQFVSVLLSFLWTLCTLRLVDRLNQHTQWWLFYTGGPTSYAMPIEFYFGWAIFWGMVPQLFFPRLALWRVIVFALAFDLYLMPFCRPFVALNHDWLYGEAVAISFVLLPALFICRWTLQNTHLNLRTTLQVALSGMVFLFLLPEIVFAVRPGAGWSPLIYMPGWQRQLAVQMLLILAVPGVSAVMEFAQRGGGTPIPYDPPQRLVTSGIYRYVANPMQLSCGLVMLLWTAMLHNIWLTLAACTSIIYSAGIAEWDEGQDLAARFGADWKLYRAHVKAWRIRWRPFHSAPPARLYIARTCGPCSELRAWLAARNPLGLDFIDVESLPPGSIRRLRYDPSDGASPVDGVRAFARALEHLNFGWTLCGAALRLPLIWQFTQLLMDASGLGPRQINSASATPPAR